MKVLHVIPRIGLEQGGLRSATIAICRAMQSAGIEVEIACLEENQVSDPEGIPVRRFKPGLHVLASSTGMRNWLIEHASKYDALIAHVVWLNPTHYAAQAAARAGIPLLLASHGMLDPDALTHHRMRKLVRWHLGVRKLVRKSVLVFTTEEDRDRGLSNPGLEGMANVVVPNPVEPINPHKEDQPPIVLCLNRMHPRKGVREFVQAVELLKEHGLEFQAVHAGNPEQKDYADEVEDLGAASVDFRGRLPRSEVIELLRRSAVVVHPATGHENFGMVVAEAMAAGKAVVGSPRALVMPQLAAAGVAKMVEPEPGAIADAVEDLLRDEHARQDLGKRARAYAQEHFSYAKVGQRWLEVLNAARHSVPDDPAWESGG